MARDNVQKKGQKKVRKIVQKKVVEKKNKSGPKNIRKIIKNRSLGFETKAVAG